MVDSGSILVTGAAGQLGAVGRTVTSLLLQRGLPVRAMVHREDDRAAALRAAGAEVVVGDLLEPADVYRVVSGCRRVYFGMSVSAGYLEAALTMAAVAREVGVNALVNMSQMTVSQMSIQNTTPSHQQRQHWLSEQVLSWSGLPVVTIRPTMFLESLFPLAGVSVRERGRIELPFGNGKTSPVAAADVARVVATILADPGRHLGRIYELTGPRSQDMHGVAREFADALNREVTYSDIAPEYWERELKRQKVPEHLTVRRSSILKVYLNERLRKLIRYDVIGPPCVPRDYSPCRVPTDSEENWSKILDAIEKHDRYRPLNP